MLLRRGSQVLINAQTGQVESNLEATDWPFSGPRRE
jgi:hypothetical protein